MGILSVSTATAQVTSVAHKGRKPGKRTKRHRHCPCGIEAKEPSHYDNSTIVKVSVEIDERGNVTSATALNGRRELQQRAEADALKMKFEPAKLDGKPIGAARIVTFDYTSKDQ
jgi:hypothetical protein